MNSLTFIFQIIVAIFLVRFHVNHYQLGYNPIVNKLNQLTNAFVLPFNRIIKVKGWDIGALIVGWIIAVLLAVLFYHDIYRSLVYGTVYLFAYTWLNLLMIALFIVVIGSWLQTQGTQPIMQIALSCTEWMMQPIRKILPSFGGLDFSPIIAFFIISFAKQGLWQLLLRGLL